LPELAGNAITLTTAVDSLEDHAPDEYHAFACLSGRDLLSSLHILRC
jgi:hypothetical protein